MRMGGESQGPARDLGQTAVFGTKLAQNQITELGHSQLTILADLL